MISKLTLSKMHLYKTAYSPVYEKYVAIKNVRKDIAGELVLDCTIAGYPKDNLFMFRPQDLESFCL